MHVDRADGELVEHRGAQRVGGSAAHDAAGGQLREALVGDAEAARGKLLGDDLAGLLQQSVDVRRVRVHPDVHMLLNLIIYGGNKKAVRSSSCDGHLIHTSMLNVLQP